MNIQQSLLDRQIIHCDAEIMSGVPVFTGTRVPLQTFFDYIADEEGLAEFLEDFPYLRKQVFQVLEITLRQVLVQEDILVARSA